MRYYLDTNTLAFHFVRSNDDIHVDVRAILNDSSNVVCTSTLCVMELIQLCQIGRLPRVKRVTPPAVTSVLNWIDESCITMIPVTRKHFQALAELPMCEDHRDSVDRLIVAQAITDRATLISSDHKMKLYTADGLHLVFNKR